MIYSKNYYSYCCSLFVLSTNIFQIFVETAYCICKMLSAGADPGGKRPCTPNHVKIVHSTMLECVSGPLLLPCAMYDTVWVIQWFVFAV